MKVAVIDIRAVGTDAEAAKILTEILVHEVGKVPGVSVISNVEIANLLSLEAQKQMLGCDEDASCAAEIAGSLGVDKLCTGSFGRLDATQVLTLRLIDVKSAKTEKRVLQPVEGGAAKFLDRMPAMVAELFPDRVAKPSSAAPSLAVSSGPAPGVPSSSAPAPAARTAPAPATIGAARSQPYGDPWVWAGVGAAAMLVGMLWSATVPEFSPDSEYVVPVSIFLGGLIAVVASPVICLSSGAGGAGEFLPPLDSPFASPDTSPDRRTAVALVPAHD